VCSVRLFTVVVHGVPADLIARMQQTTKGYFTASEERKRRAANRGSGVAGCARRVGPTKLSPRM
jgi:hypothetical protein